MDTVIEIISDVSWSYFFYMQSPFWGLIGFLYLYIIQVVRDQAVQTVWFKHDCIIPSSVAFLCTTWARLATFYFLEVSYFYADS